jgi:hypothetical protein
MLPSFVLAGHPFFKLRTLGNDVTKVIKRWANDQQRWFVERGAAPTLLAGGINSGKTVGGVLKSLALMIKYPGSRIAVVRRSLTQLQKTVMETWYQWCLPKMYDKGHRTETVLDLNNGSRAYFIHLDQPNSLDLLAGLELNFAFASQVDEVSEKAWDLLDVRVGRWTGATIPEEDFQEFGGRENWPWRSSEGIYVPPRYLFAEGYVTDEGHWLYDRFSPDSSNREKWEKLGYEGRIVFSEENIYAIRATLDASLAKDKDYIRRYVRPQWGNPEGRVFEVDPSSLLQPEPALVQKVLRQMKLHRSLDHGEFSPTCCLWHATDHDNNIFVYREHYQGNALVSAHRRLIFELSKLDGWLDRPKYYSNLADPTIFNKTRGRSLYSAPTHSVADEYTDSVLMPSQTAIYWTEADNNPEATVSRLKEYLAIDPNHQHPVTGRVGAPHLYFIMKAPEYPYGCNQVVKDVRSQMRKRAKVADREVWLDARDETISDHAYDALVYFVVSRPSLGPMVPIAALVPGEMRVADYEAADRAVRHRKRLEERRAGVGRLGYGVQ